MLRKLSTYKELENVRIGLFGSYSRNEQKLDSDIDIVYSLEKSEDNSLNQIQFFIEDFVVQYENKFDVVWLELLKEEDEKLDKLAIELGVGINDVSPYKELLKDVIWIN